MLESTPKAFISFDFNKDDLIFWWNGKRDEQVDINF